MVMRSFARSAPAHLVTARLRLHPVGPEDAAEMAGVLADESLYAWTGGAPPTPASLRSQYAIWAVAGAAAVGGRRFDRTWVLRASESGEAVGFAQVSVSSDRSAAELAWVVGRAWQGRGYAREAATRLAQLAHDEGVPVLRANIAAGHLASERVAAAIGMTVTDRLVDGERVWEYSAA